MVSTAQPSPLDIKFCHGRPAAPDAVPLPSPLGFAAPTEKSLLVTVGGFRATFAGKNEDEAGKNMRHILIVLILLAGFTGAASAQDYKIRPGDRLEINVWQDPKLNRVVIVAPDGRISFPLAGQIRAGGRTVDNVEAELKKRLSSQYSEDVDISVAYADRPPDPPKEKEEKILPGVFVLGEVSKPGKVEYRSSMNVLQALASAGGLSPFAAEKRIKIRRKIDGEETLIDFNYKDFVSGKDLSGNVLLRNGDVIIVPERGLFE